jgi:hypothetical protein
MTLSEVARSADGEAEMRRTEMRAEGPVAPWWHTVAVAAGLAGMSVASARQHGLPNLQVPGMSGRASGYLTVIVAE